MNQLVDTAERKI